MSDYVPYELLIEILTRVPVRSLIRFTLVCKSWCSLIRSPNFIASHLKQTISRQKLHKNPTLFLRHYDKNDKKEHYRLHHDDDTFGDEFCELEFPFKSPIGFFRIVGSCNGLICLSDDLFGDTRTIILWNPSIRKWVTLPMPIRPKWPHMFVLGYGVDPETHDFKVVRIVYYKDYSYSCKLPPDVEIYSLNRGCWSKVGSDIPPYCMVEFMWSQAFLQGAVHWIGYSVDDVFRCYIVLFDISVEVFGEMMLPDDLAGEHAANLCITVLGECLAVLKNDKQIESTTCCVWVMKEYGIVESWTKLFTVDLGGILERTVGFRRNGEMLLSQKFGELVSYDPKASKIKDLGIVGSTRSFYVDDYLESLILLRGWGGESEGCALWREVNEVEDWK